nr:transmembrane protein 87A [Tanacetum cinerariifolium]
MSSYDSLTATILFLLIILRFIYYIEASVHEYAGQTFAKKGNAYVVHGGSEGIYYSRSYNNNLNLSSSFSANGDAYIRFERIVFRRPQEVSNFSTGLIYAVLFEVDDRWVHVRKGKLFTASLSRILVGLKYLVSHLTSMKKLPLCNQVCEILEREFNKSGVRPTGITVWAVTFGTVKRTVSRMIILTVSMGYGVVRPTLGGLTSKVILLGATFFIASEVLELAEHVGAISDLSGNAILFLSLPVAILDAFFILWIFTSLSATLNKLQAKRMMAKLDIYRKFTNALAVAVIVSVGWICFELYFKSTDIYNDQWQNAWIIPAFWHVLSFSLLCVISALWAPSQNSMRYAYSDDGSEEFDEDELLMFMKPSLLPTKDVGSPTEVRSAHSDDGVFGGDMEEGKTE